MTTDRQKKTRQRNFSLFIIGGFIANLSFIMRNGDLSQDEILAAEYLKTKVIKFQHIMRMNNIPKE